MRVFAIAKRIVRQILRDKRTMALLFIAPLFVMTLLWLVLDTEAYRSPNGLSTFDRVGPILVGFFIFFFTFIISGISFLRERTQGTLERLLATPLQRWEIVDGYILGFGIFVVIQSLIVVTFSVYVLNLYMVGSFLVMLVVSMVLALSALTLGTFLSAFAKNEFQVVQFIPIVIVPQFFFAGVFDIQFEWLKAFGKIMPLHYGAEALQAVMLHGDSIRDVLFELGVILTFSTVFIWFNVLALKQHRKL